MKKLLLSLTLLVLSGCSSISDESKNTAVNIDNLAPKVKRSMGIEYLAENTPLNDKFISLPFLFDGDVVLRTDFDVIQWRNKRFISIEGKDFELSDRHIINMRKGTIKSLGGDIEFEGLQQSLLIKVLPLSYGEDTPEFLVLTHLSEIEGRGSVLIIEDPISQKIHGFIESALVSL